jgi:hypothetical protein
MNGHFIRSGGKSFKVSKGSKATERELDVILPPGLAAKYVVEKKAIPANMPTSWVTPGGQTRPITWIGNFGLKQIGKASFVKGSVSEHYEIILDKPADKTLVYFDGGVNPFPAVDTQDRDDLPGKCSARLKLGDPPIGMG